MAILIHAFVVCYVYVYKMQLPCKFYVEINTYIIQSSNMLNLNDLVVSA